MQNAGSAYIFERNANGNWSQIQKIIASDRTSDDRFGTISIDGNYAIVGAWMQDEDASGGNFMYNAGSAYIFELSNVGISENDFGSSFNFYPNPTSGKLIVDLGKTYKSIEIIVRNTLGQVVLTRSYKAANLLHFEIKGALGVYFIEVQTSEDKSAILRVFKE